MLLPRIDFMAAQATRHDAPFAVKHGAPARLTGRGTAPISAAAYWHSANKTANALQNNNFLSNANAAFRAATRMNNGEAQVPAAP
jgi:hypothetical protein